MTLPTGRRGNYTNLIWGVFLFCLFPFLLLSFFNIMTTDDFILYNSCRDRGFLSTQSYIYGWTGRYTATFIGSVLLEMGLPQWYFLHTWVLLGGTWSALLFVLMTVNTMVMKRLYRPGTLASGASVLLLLFLYVQAEISTGLYWFSSAITYQPAFILFLFLVGCLIRRYYTGLRRYDVLIMLLIFLIVGCNEIAAVFLTFLLLTLLIGYYRTRSVGRILQFYLLVAIAADLLIVISSGLFTLRYKEMGPSGGYINIFPIVLFRAFSVFYAIFKTPLFWIAAATLYFAGAKMSYSPTLKAEPATFKERRIFIPGLIILSGLMVLTLAAITLITRGPLPQRALNNLIELTAFGLLALFFTAGILHRPDWAKAWTDVAAKMHSWVLPGLILSTMIAADAFADAWSSCFTGYFYAAAERAREKQIQAAAQSHQKTIVLEPFEESLQREIQRVFPHGTFETVHQWLQTKPALLYFAQDAENADRGYAEFCGIDSVNIERTNGKDSKK